MWWPCTLLTSYIVCSIIWKRKKLLTGYGYSNWLITSSMWLDLCLGVHFAVCLILNWIVFDSNHFWLANTTCVKWCLCTSIAEGACDCVCVSVCVLSHFLERSLPDWYVPQTNCMYAHCWVYQSLQRTLLVFFLYHTAAKVLYVVDDLVIPVVVLFSGACVLWNTKCNNIAHPKMGIFH